MKVVWQWAATVWVACVFAILPTGSDAQTVTLTCPVAPSSGATFTVDIDVTRGTVRSVTGPPFSSPVEIDDRFVVWRSVHGGAYRVDRRTLEYAFWFRGQWETTGVCRRASGGF